MIVLFTFLPFSQKRSTDIATIDNWLQLKCIGKDTYKLVERLKNALEDIFVDFYQSPPCQKLATEEAINANKERLAAANSIIRLAIECFKFKTSV